MKVTSIGAVLASLVAHGASAILEDTQDDVVAHRDAIERLLSRVERKQFDRMQTVKSRLEARYATVSADLRASIQKHQKDYEPVRSVLDSHRKLQSAGRNAERKVAKMTKRVQCIDPQSNANNLWFDGCNVHIRNGNNQKATDKIDGKGNLIMGYSDNGLCLGGACERSGSHNLIVGDNLDYLSYGGIVAGVGNRIEGPYASVLGGQRNVATGIASSITCGEDNTVTGQSASILGGTSESASRFAQTIPN